METKDNGRFNICFLLIDGFSMISFASAVDPFRIANKLLGRNHFHYCCTSVDGKPVCSSSGIEIGADFSLEELTVPDVLILASSDGVEKYVNHTEIGDHLRKLERHGVRIGAICTGSYLLAEFGLLRGRACAIHWEYQDIAKEAFPGEKFFARLFVQDRGLITSAGGTAPIDMVVSIIAEETGSVLANQVRDVAIHHEIREGSAHQRLEIHWRYNVHDRQLVRCLELMEENIEFPLGLSELCDQLDINKRTLQRLFKRELNQAPIHCYNEIRLEHARYLVQHSTLSIREIALASGFPDRSHFGRAYKRKYQLSPADTRARMRMERFGPE